MDFIQAAKRVEELSQSFVTRVGGFETQVNEREAQVLREAEQFSRMPGADSDVRRTVSIAARNNAQREARAYRRRLAAGTDEERTERLKELVGIDREAIAWEPLYASPVQMLSRVGLGSPERSRYQEQLASAGPRELLNYAQWAERTGDRVLAAAVITRLDTLPTPQRPIKATEYALRIIGEDFGQVRDAFKRIRNATQHAINVNREFERGRVDSKAKIGLALARAGK